MRTFKIILLLVIGFPFGTSRAAVDPLSGAQVHHPDTWNKFYTYVPTKEDYALEIGSMWERKNLYWLGALVGFHTGTCPFARMRDCQNYVDIIAGAGGRNGLNSRLMLASLRFQFVNFPSSYSPLARAFVGGIHIRDSEMDRSNRFNVVYGFGFGVTTSVHQRVDLKTEVRIGHGDQLWSQVFLSANVKIDKWIDYFAAQINEFSRDTTGVAKDACKSTIELPGDLADRIEKTVQGQKKSPSEADQTGSESK